MKAVLTLFIYSPMITAKCKIWTELRDPVIKTRNIIQFAYLHMNLAHSMRLCKNCVSLRRHAHGTLAKCLMRKA